MRNAFISDQNAPILNAEAIVPSDSADINLPIRAIIVTGASGRLVCRMENGVEVDIPVLAGAFLPLRPIRVLTTTTATGLVAAW